jgi:methylenetetrahydrofolate--tRNA-(uracil-5-)-methyltransferase
VTAVHVVGGGLAGSEAAWQLAERGHDVVLHEMRPVKATPAHQTDRFAELVCSNTFKSTEVTNAHGLLKAEMRALGAMVLACADEARVPGGSALAVDRDLFAAAVSARIAAHPRIRVAREEVTGVPSPAVIATGPLTSDALAAALRARLGGEALSFYDAIAPIVSRESLDDAVVFRASRWGKETMEGAGEEGAYLNCPFTRDEYEAWVHALGEADQYQGKAFDEVPYFEGCMPVEEMARRGAETLRFGPMRPIGLVDPRTGKRPWAVVQLRMEDRAGRMWNLVGCQTRLRIPEQTRIFRMIPGLANAEFLRFGAIHRNAYVNSPAVLGPQGQLRNDPQVFLAGQMTGVEGYTESTASGLLAAINLDRTLRGLSPASPPPTTMLGALCRHLREADPAHFQPMNANFGLLEALTAPPRDKDARKQAYADRALADMAAWRDQALAEPASASA